MKTKIYIAFALLTLGCTIGKRQVFFNEMFSEPEALLTENGLLIKTENSKENSALLIYKIESKIDVDKNEIRLTGYQAPAKKFNNEFEIKLDNEVIDNIGNYRLIWIDPDGNENEITIKTHYNSG